MSKLVIPENAKRVFKGVLYDVYQWEQELFDGTKATFEALDRPDTIEIIPVLPNGHILVQKEWQPDTRPFIDFPGGRIDEGETFGQAAKRELLEETGYEASDWHLWMTFHPILRINWDIAVFIAKGLKKVANPNPDAGEKFEPLEYSFEDLLTIPDNPDFRSLSGPVIQELIRAKYDPRKQVELKKRLTLA